MTETEKVELEILKAKFWARVDVPLGRHWQRRCWKWNGAITTDRPAGPTGGWGGGYGCLREPITGRWIRAHRYIWELLHGPIPDGMLIGHICSRFGSKKDNRDCVNPNHLILVNHSENLKHAYETGQRGVPF